jgi:hypothetical protein
MKKNLADQVNGSEGVVFFMILFLSQFPSKRNVFASEKSANVHKKKTSPRSPARHYHNVASEKDI